MKISKVSHVRSAVSVDREGRQGGILYDSPIKDGRDSAQVDMTLHIQSLNSRAQSLYGVLNPVKKQYDEAHHLIPVSTEEILMRKNFGMLIKFLLRRPKPDDPEDVRISKQKSTLFGIHRYSIYKNKKTGKEVSGDQLGVKGDPAALRKLAEEITEKSLRKAFRKKVQENGKEVDLKVVVRTLLFAVTQLQPDYKGPYIRVLKELSDEDLYAFFKVLHKDYYKEDQLKAIEQSIHRQNVRVQPALHKGVLRLQIAGGEDKNRDLFAWMCDYAAGDEGKKQELIRSFRGMLILYFLGNERYEKALHTESFTAFSFGEALGEEEKLDAELFDSLLEEIAKMQGEKDDNIHVKKHLDQEQLDRLRHHLETCHKEAVAAKDLTAAEHLWIQYIGNKAMKLLTGGKIQPARLYIRKLSGEIFREWTSYMSIKFIDLGKAVYHFAMPDDLEDMSLEGASFGDLQEGYEKGLSSFDYERIKADETIQRDMSGFVSFAVSNFGRSAYDVDLADQLLEDDHNRGGADDILYIRTKYLKQSVYADAPRRILRFFGGMSTWMGSAIDGTEPLELVLALRDSMRITRNHNFHYSAKATGTVPTLIKRMCVKEYLDLGRKYRDRWYSNNVLMFYTEGDITALMDELYKHQKENHPFIPAFQRLFRNGGEVYENIIRSVNAANEAAFLKPDSELMMQYQACLFFLMKEIYFFGFLLHPHLMDMIRDAFDDMEKRDHDRAHLVAMQSVRERIRVLGENPTFSEVCELLLTDVNMQNNNMRKHAASQEKAELFGHYKVLLYNATREAFVKYLTGEANRELFGFLFRPFMHASSPITQVEFEGNWAPHTFDYVKQIGDDDLCLAWYATGHFLSAVQLNKLTGKIRSYLRFLENVDSRAESIQNRKGKDTARKLEQYTKVLLMLQFVKNFVGDTNLNPNDYYEDNDAYSRYLADYLDFDASEGSAYEKALAFNKQACGEIYNASPYFVGNTPIVNRNIIFAQMFGNSKLLGDVLKPITAAEVKEYLDLTRSLRSVFNKLAKDRTQEEAKAFHRYMKMKNRLELHNVLIYTGLISDLYAQLISWAYLRERDLMYMQLGYAYVKLFWTDSIPEKDPRRTLSLPSQNLSIRDGALLYEIVAMNAHNTRMFVPSTEGEGLRLFTREGGIGAGVSAFCKLYGDGVYREGLELFMDVSRSFKRQVAFRNALDHFAYFHHPKESMIRMYARVYDEFFTYDTKLKKSVSLLFKNILTGKALLPQTTMDGHEEDGDYTSGFGLAGEGLHSDTMRSKIDTGERIILDKWSPLELGEIRALLEYSE
ncbi:MAG: type VI-A CRISPR-associated RNA-guided ribonuclease Cas13a [Lachnospiraceae bacterium]|nr:type VI-A CRISPR-associated RNA-guided ribonuclease Cas13a [Lachnospiraceae bacterium]